MSNLISDLLNEKAGAAYLLPPKKRKKTKAAPEERPAEEKLANLGGSGGETEFEQAFSSLAYAYLRDKAPRLLDHMLGFQLVDRNEDNTKAVGIFGFQLGAQWLYAPVFFLNGDLKGHELLYMKNNDSFVPLKENWVNYLMARKPHVLGEPSSASKLRELGGIYPDVRTLSIPPSVGGGKRAADLRPASLPDYALKPVLPFLAAVHTKQASSLYAGVVGSKLNQQAVVAEPFSAALAKVASKLDLNRILPTSLPLLKTAFAAATAYPQIRHGFRRFYGADCFERWGAELRNSVSKKASSILPTTPRVRYKGASLIPESDTPAAVPRNVDHVKEGKLRLYISQFVISPGESLGSRAIENAEDVTNVLGDGAVDNADLSTDEREKLLRDTVLIRDSREDAETSKTFNVQIEAKLFNPDSTNLYRVLEKPGNFTKMLVIKAGLSNCGTSECTTVVNLDGTRQGKRWLNTYSQNVWTDQVADPAEWSDWFDGLSSTRDLKEGAEYVGVCSNGQCTTPFNVRANYGDGRFRVTFEIYADSGENRPPGLSWPKTLDHANSPSPYGAMLFINKEGAKGRTMRAINGELRLPADVRFILLAEPQPCGTEIMCCSPPPVSTSSRSDVPPIQLGKIDDIQLLFLQKTAQLRIYSNGTEVHVDSPCGEQRLTKKAALWYLVSTEGLREKTARELLQRAEHQSKVVYRIAYAAGYGTEKAAAPNTSVLAGGPSGPIYDDYAEDRAVEQYGPSTAVPTQYGAAAAYRLNDLAADQTDPGVWYPWSNFEASDFQQSAQIAQQGAAQGQKEIFDTSMISGMLKSVRQDSLVERHLGDLVEALDSLGRLLFNFYWHSEEFEDRYGKADLPELEDSLRNAFESLGDITLFLKEKTIESPFDAGEISLDEAGRN